MLILQAIKRIKLSKSNSNTPIILYKNPCDYGKYIIPVNNMGLYLEAGAINVFEGSTDYGFYLEVDELAKIINLYLAQYEDTFKKKSWKILEEIL